MRLIAILALVGCGAQQAQQQYGIVEYGSEQTECAVKYQPDRAAIDACRNSVKAKYGRLDGGSDG